MHHYDCRILTGATSPTLLSIAALFLSLDSSGFPAPKLCGARAAAPVPVGPTPYITKRSALRLRSWFASLGTICLATL